MDTFEERRRSMKRLLAKVLITLFVTASSVWVRAAQTPPKPSPEVQKEGNYFVGNWKFTGETKPSPFGPGGQRFEASERLEWMPGGFFLMARSYEGDKWSGVTVIGYDENRKVFSHTSYTESGKIETMEGTVQGDTDTWSGEGTARGKPVKQRMTIKKLSSTSYTFKMEVAPENGNWSLVYEGQAVKTP
jgi:hypothetical protein